MLKLELQYFGYLMWRADSFEKTVMLGRVKEGGGGDNRGWDGWMASPTLWTWVWASSGNWWWTSMLQCMGSGKSHTQLSNWTELAEPWVRYNLPNSYLIGLSFSASLYSSLKRNASPHWWSLLYLSVSVWLMWDWHFHGWSWKDPVIWSWIGPSSYSERNF